MVHVSNANIEITSFSVVVVAVVAVAVAARRRNSRSIFPIEERTTPPHPGTARHATDFIDECERGATKDIRHPHVVFWGDVLKEK